MGKRFIGRRAFASLGLAVLLALPGCARGKASPSRKGILTVSQEQHASWIRNFNPLLAPGSSRWPTRAGIYEPMLIYNTMKGEYTPWLATKYAWSEGNKRLTFTTRPSVKWSDGQPFTARDVAFTFELLKKHKALDLNGAWGFLESVTAKDDATVVFTLSRAYVPGLVYIGQQPIVPEHKWKDVADPVTYTNEQPVATGPFTEVKVFQNQVYELGRNPSYWQEGKPAITGLRFPAYPGNDQANLALLNGEVDWAGNFVPDIDRAFVRRDPASHHYWFPLVGGTVMLYTNTTRKPTSDVRVRKALSMAIDREQIVKVAMYNYTRPSDATGLNDAYERWRSAKAIVAGDWVKLDLEKAGALLDEAGYKMTSAGHRASADGTPLRFEINVVAGWSDWVRAAQIIAQNLKRAGAQASMKAYDFSAFFEKLQKGEFDLSMGWSAEEPTPYNFYRDMMGTETVRPVGELSARNWHRFGSPEADARLTAFAITSDEAEQRRLADDLQAFFVESAPSIPLFPNPSWGEYNTSRFTGFPSKESPYAKLSPNNAPEYLLVLTEIKPR
jgi:peptide/nickel transport system substrate-binding protein